MKAITVIMLLAGVSLHAFSLPTATGAHPVQQRQVSGTVTDQTGKPLPGVSIRVKGNSSVAVTNAAGRYTIGVSDADAVLVFSFMGFGTVERRARQANEINVSLQPQDDELSEVVVIGYGEVRKTDLTGSVGQVNMSDMEKAPVASFAEALAGRVAGVQVTASDGQPGTGINIMIRGVGSLTQSTAPLYVIDGFPVENPDPATLNPEEIESITVLKDASSTAIFGSRGSNGVVLIQTKRGVAGKPVVSVSSSNGFQSTPPKMEVMSPYEFVKYQSELNPNLASTRAFFAGGKTLEDYRNVKGVNFQDAVFRTGKVQIHDLALRGGNDQTRYSVSGSIYNQEGVVINTGFSRYSGRVTLDQAISNKIKAGITGNYSGVTQFGQVLREGAINNGNATAFVLARVWMYRPLAANPDLDLLEDDLDEDAVASSDWRVNPFKDLENQHRFDWTNLLEANGYVSYDITPELVFKSSAGIRHNHINRERFYNSKTSQGGRSPGNVNGINGTVSDAAARAFVNSNTLNFKKTLKGGHTVTGLGLFEVSSVRSSTRGYGGRLLPNEELGIDGLDQGLAFNPTMAHSINTMVSYATRWDYNYQSKYMLTFNFRADGSSKFKDHWGYFPGAAIAWNMHQEGFFKRALPAVSTSKIRMSYGSNGNNRVGDFDYAARLIQDMDGYAFNNQPIQSVYVSAVGNEGLRWEKTKTLDLGYELGLFKNRISLEVDLYRRVTRDLLLNAQLPRTTGYNAAVKNIGVLQNEGMEFTLNTDNIKTTSFNWQSSFNIGFNRNRIVELTRGQRNMQTVISFPAFTRALYLSEIGQPAGMMIGYIWEGNYQFEDFDNPAPGVYVLKSSVPGNGAARNTIQPGDIKYRDLNGDGTMTEADITFIGRGQPIHTGGFANNFYYKGFNLHVFFQWAYGNDVYNANRLLMEGSALGYANINQFASYANRWTPENPTNEHYRTRGFGPVGYHSSKVVEDASFLRLKTVSLGYTIPARYIQKLYLTNLSLNVAAQNLVTWTGYSGLDPEVSTRNHVLSPGYDYAAYPRVPTLVFGLKAAF